MTRPSVLPKIYRFHITNPWTLAIIYASTLMLSTLSMEQIKQASNKITDESWKNILGYTWKGYAMVDARLRWNALTYHCQNFQRSLANRLSWLTKRFRLCVPVESWHWQELCNVRPSVSQSVSLTIQSAVRKIVEQLAFAWMGGWVVRQIWSPIHVLVRS